MQALDVFLKDRKAILWKSLQFKISTALVLQSNSIAWYVFKMYFLEIFLERYTWSQTLTEELCTDSHQTFDTICALHYQGSVKCITYCMICCCSWMSMSRYKLSVSKWYYPERIESHFSLQIYNFQYLMVMDLTYIMVFLLGKYNDIFL